ncbi:MAG: ATP-binding cassette domain-containing protein [Oscillospiraceae bacterium]|jgi:oligopeptide/dipeptide ABC transporter ATP-binding protein|nr:ATP-binding cassette domain-containing protein [Oscillospiraceae bacterium]
MAEELLRVENLKVYYPVAGKEWLGGGRRFVRAVDGVSFAVNAGEAFGLVGESGCGKSTTGKTLARLIQPTEGRVLFGGRDLFAPRDQAAARALTRRIQLIFQDPYSSLDPQFTVGRTIAEPMLVNGLYGKKERTERVLALMEEVGLRPDHFSKYPHEFSGGQRQRIGVARALALHPELVVCDEPVSALDVSIQAQILNLMKSLQRKHGLTYVFISHNLAVVRHLCDRIAVMYLGHIVEIAPKKALFEHPAHPYTAALMEAIPVPDPASPCMQETLEGDVPNPVSPPCGCCFHTRCKYAEERCTLEPPETREIGPGHLVACHFR